MIFFKIFKPTIAKRKSLRKYGNSSVAPSVVQSTILKVIYRRRQIEGVKHIKWRVNKLLIDALERRYTKCYKCIPVFDYFRKQCCSNEPDSKCSTIEIFVFVLSFLPPSTGWQAVTGTRSKRLQPEVTPSERI